MKTAPRQIVAFGGGGFSMESGNPLLDDYVLGLCRAERPRVCFLPSASGDADHYIVRFYRAFPADRCEASHISLFRREQGPEDLRRHLLSQDLIYVGGGSVVSLLGVWRAHGIDEILREAWEAGVDPLRPLGRLAVLVRRGGDRLPRRSRAASRASACCRSATASTTSPARAAASPTTASSATGCAPATRPRTAPPCTSPATELSRVVASRPEARGYRLDPLGRAGGRDADRDRLPRRRRRSRREAPAARGDLDRRGRRP